MSRALDFTIETTPPHSVSAARVLTACRIAVRYSHRPPTIAELRRDFGMSRATAFRWRAAITIARQESQA